MRHGWPNGVSESRTVILATGNGYADALAAAPLAGILDAPILLVPRTSLTNELAGELRRLFSGRAAATLIVVGGEGAIPGTIVHEARQALAAGGVAEITIDRLAGADRFGTARAIATRVGTPATGTFARTAFVVSGRNYPDALAVSGLAAATGVPVLPVEPNSVPGDIASALAELRVEHVTIVGGPGAVSSQVESWLESHGYRRPGITDGAMAVDTRISGANRYETALEVGRYAIALGGFTTDTVYFATGLNWPDALALGPVAGKQRRTVLLIHGAEIGYSERVAEHLMGRRTNPPACVFIGGHSAISDYVRGQVRIALDL